MPDWCLTIDLRLSMRPYMYMGRYCPKEGKKRRKRTCHAQAHQCVKTLQIIIKK